MVTVVNTPPGSGESDSGVGLIVGIILAIVVIALFFIYGLPALRNSAQPVPQDNNRDINIDVDLPNVPGDTSGGSGSGGTGTGGSGSGSGTQTQ